MRFNRALLLLTLLAACASPEGEFPSLARRPAELGVLPPPAPVAPAAPPTADVLTRIDQLVGQAGRAHSAFLADAPGARRTVEAGRGQRAGDAWARAEVALANLEATRGPATAALADLDRIYADAATAGNEVARIGEARDTVAAQVTEQNRTIDSLAGMLG